ncbi:MAG: helix-turn-helix domain-containing protein [Mycobacteriales bacterium]
MKNNLGPEGVPAGAAEAGQPRARAAVLAALRRQPGPVTLNGLAAATGLHPNTLREHLEALVDAGRVQRTRAQPSGRGRPAALYEALPEGRGPSEYAGLAVALAGALRRTSAAPREDALRAGAEWGRVLVRERPSGGTSDARQQVVELLAELRFAPGADGSLVRLTRCPLLEAARSDPEVVCSVHLGIVRGALTELGTDPAGSSLEPFSEPGACRLSLGAGNRL